VSGSGGALGHPAFDAGTDPNRNQVPGGQYCDRLATVQCAGEAACCDSPGRTFDQCKTTMKNGCQIQLYLDAVTSNPVSGYDMTRAASTFAQFERMASNCDPNVAFWGIAVDGLRGCTAGTIVAGGGCEPPIAQLGNKAIDAAYLVACLNPAAAACLPGSLAWTCAARSAAGGPCFTDLNCVDGLFCDNPNLSLTGSKCTARKADGQGCKAANECATLACKGGSCAPVGQQSAYCLAN
jgi:hypothetical protein